MLSQKNNYGIHNSSIIIENGNLVPITLMATYYQQSPLVFITTEEIKRPRDLLGKTIMGTKNELTYSSLALMLNHFTINQSNSTFKQHNFSIEDFVNKKVDVMSAFRTNQPYQLNQLGIEYNIIDPMDYGFMMSAVNLFTSPSETAKHPKRTKDFVHASNKGWAYALDHPEETVAVIFHKYSQQKSIKALTFEANVAKNMMLPDFFDIGATNRELSERILNQLQYSGLLRPQQKLGKFIFKQMNPAIDHNVQLTDKEQSYLYQKKKITMCVDPDWMPFESIRNKKHVGIAAEIFANHFEAWLPVPIELIQSKSWQDTLTKAKNRECDILSLATPTPERLKYLDFTPAYISLPNVLATKVNEPFINDISEVKNKKLGIVKGFAIAELLRNEFENINIVDVESIADGLKRVESGELFGYIDNLTAIAYQIQKGFTGSLKVSARLDDTIGLAVGTRNDEPQLQAIFEQLVLHLPPDELQRTYNNWVSIKQDIGFDYSLFWQLLAATLLLLGTFLYYNLKLRNLNEKLLKLSTTDKLTGLCNRVKTDDLLLKEKANMDRYDIKSSILMVDIDLFKNVNDQHGHLIGDKVLIETSKLFIKNVRETDVVSRWGGEEFLIICPNTDKDDARIVADKLHQVIQTHTYLNHIHLTISIGISSFTAGKTIENTVSQADKALYQAKQKGRNQVSQT